MQRLTWNYKVSTLWNKISGVYVPIWSSGKENFPFITLTDRRGFFDPEPKHYLSYKLKEQRKLPAGCREKLRELFNERDGQNFIIWPSILYLGTELPPKFSRHLPNILHVPCILPYLVIHRQMHPSSCLRILVSKLVYSN